MPERFNPLHATNVEVTAKCDDDGAESSSHDSEPVVSKRETDFQALRGVRGVAEVDSESCHKLRVHSRITGGWQHVSVFVVCSGLVRSCTFVMVHWAFRKCIDIFRCTCL